jgi:hypothetical protein
MAELSIQSLTTTGLISSYTAAASAGDEIANSGYVFVHFKNGAGAPTTVTIASQVAPVPKGTTLIDLSIEVTAAGEKMAGFFNDGAFNDSSGMMQLTYSTHTSLTIAAISVT